MTPPLHVVMRVWDDATEARHAPIPLAWMTPASARLLARDRAWLVAAAGIEVMDARRAGRGEAYEAAVALLRDAQAAYAEMVA